MLFKLYFSSKKLCILHILKIWNLHFYSYHKINNEVEVMATGFLLTNVKWKVEVLVTGNITLFVHIANCPLTFPKHGKMFSFAGSNMKHGAQGTEWFLKCRRHFAFNMQPFWFIPKTIRHLYVPNIEIHLTRNDTHLFSQSVVHSRSL